MVKDIRSFFGTTQTGSKKSPSGDPASPDFSSKAPVAPAVSVAAAPTVHENKNANSTSKTPSKSNIANVDSSVVSKMSKRPTSSRKEDKVDVISVSDEEFADESNSEDEDEEFERNSKKKLSKGRPAPR